MPFTYLVFGKGRLIWNYFYAKKCFCKDSFWDTGWIFLFKSSPSKNSLQPSNHNIQLWGKTKVKFWVKQAKIAFPDFRGNLTNMPMNAETVASSFPTCMFYFLIDMKN